MLSHIVIGRISAENVATTLSSALAQLTGTGDLAVTVVVERGQSLGVTDPRLTVLEADAEAPIAERENLAAFSRPDATTLRFLEDGDLLLPTATGDDVAALTDAPWCAGGAADSGGSVINRRGAGTVPSRTVLEEWVADTAALTVHPNTAAYQFKFFAALGGFPAVSYGHRTALMARANEVAAGHYRTSQILVLRPYIETLRMRPRTFGADRPLIARALLEGRDAASTAAPSMSQEQVWTRISDEAWKTYTEGTATEVAPTDTLWEVLTQARKFHYRFAWAALVRYVDSAEGRFDHDDYLRAMYLTAKAAWRGDWTTAILFTQEHQVPRIVHLLLTAVFETGTADPVVLEAAVNLTQGILDADSRSAVALYRMVSFNRLLGRYETAERWRRRALDAISALDNPGLSDHLRERLLVEAVTIAPHLPRGEEIPA
ncbi:Uncharacterised protein (plasmid) [Tsukamurella tyrosinosolvens]|uniref:Glycosyl transferase family 2 n=1 Tax=Tsukamurella tyrosinosolvens TaxID=57704 RepID=A0A1H4UG78_TSUTY|nr:hypothetical protein [Tsukamurella tyrosinosolvens]KXO92936.1 hypothetical protein AXK58_13785 [Tsukamurella tyrosinosolvens]SEC67378.1 hypothetical protein SAMN04489793_2881 [Tsukamurella tyrosinosolvens]VEH94183.1 Uncharacterised protein [Tsukamurella tyrosinosolvens]